jgi:hypothetical protein
MTYGRGVLGENRIVAGSLSHDNLRMLEGVVYVLTKLSKTLDLSASERSALRSKFADAKAHLDLERGKAFLLEGKYGEAFVSLREAASSRGNKKLRFALLGLKVAPRLTRAIIAAWAKR